MRPARGLPLALLAACAGQVGGGAQDAAPATDGASGVADAAPEMPDAPPPDAAPPIDGRDRLLATYLGFLRTQSEPQTNGLDGAALPDVCALWTALDPSSRATFLTLTARLAGSRLVDGTSMLDHATTLYRVTGGEDPSGGNPGSCGGGEYNRMIVAVDPALHAALLAANQHQGAPDGSCQVDLADIPAGGFWRDSHDLGGTHAPFDTSDETEGGAPRSQTQFFADPSAAAATSPLGRLDLESLVEPYAMEMDHDFDCLHDSNPLCSYTLYGPLCAAMAEAVGTDIYVASYGDYGADFTPADCGR